QYLIKPYEYAGMTFNYITLHGNTSPWVKEKSGFYSTTMTNMPAVHDESRMPPEDQVKTWMLVYYKRTTDDRTDIEKYWAEYAKNYYDVTKSLIKPNDEVKK